MENIFPTKKNAPFLKTVWVFFKIPFLNRKGKKKGKPFIKLSQRLREFPMKNPQQNLFHGIFFQKNFPWKYFIPKTHGSPLVLENFTKTSMWI